MVKKVPGLLAVAIAGALIFWIPDVLWHFIRGRSFAGWDVISLTILLPVITLAGCAILRRINPNRLSHLLIPASMLLGIWILGPLFMAVAQSFSGGTVFTTGGWNFILKATLMFPAFTFEMSTYDGTLFAVGLASLGLISLALGIPKRYPNKLFSFLADGESNS